MADAQQGQPSPEELAMQLRAAFNSRDIDAIRALLAVGATWGEDPNGESFCHDRDAVFRGEQEQRLGSGENGADVPPSSLVGHYRD